MKKKLLSCCLCVALLFSMSACGTSSGTSGSTGQAAADTSESAESTNDNTDVEETADDAYDETISGMPNPIVPVSDASEFENKLGITIMPDLMDDDYQLSIIGDTVAQIEFDKEGVDGDPIVCTLRATKDTEAAKSLSGIYDDMEEDNLTFTLDDGNELPVLLKIPETLPCKVYEFAISDVNYSFEYSGQMSQMMFAEVFDSVLVAIGANGTDTE